jgi:DnaJ like chaperone protein
MNFWRNIAGLAVRRPDGCDDCDCPPGPPGEDPAFSTAVTALGAKLAKADGRAQVSEFDAFSQVFQTDAASERNVHRLYDLARQTTRGFESYAKRLAKRYRRCPTLLEDVLDGLFHIARSDGVVSEDELIYLETVSELFGFSPLVFRRLKATHLGLAADDPYAVLSVPHDAPDEVVRTTWPGDGACPRNSSKWPRPSRRRSIRPSTRSCASAGRCRSKARSEWPRPWPFNAVRQRSGHQFGVL